VSQENYLAMLYYNFSSYLFGIFPSPFLVTKTQYFVKMFYWSLLAESYTHTLIEYNRSRSGSGGFISNKVGHWTGSKY
jgi:hypothetical protein